MGKWIKVNTPYSGIDTNGLVVQVGVYPVGAPELYGSVEGIIEHGVAEWVDAPETVEPEMGTAEDAVELPEPASDQDPLGGWSEEELPPEVVAAARKGKRK